MIEDRPHYIVHKDTDQIIGTYANYGEAYAAYKKLGTGNDGMSDHAIGLVLDEGVA